MEDNEQLHFLLKRYWENNCSKEEFAELLSLSNQAKNRQLMEKELRLLWEENDAAHTNAKVEWDSKYKSIIEFAQNYPVSQPSKPPFIRRPFLRAAAVIFAVIGAALILWRTILQPEKLTLTATANVEKKLNKVNNNKQVINLPDGSTVILNNESKLVYPPVFTGRTRDVYLTGEAYFDIHHNPAKPFIVHTGAVTTKVLGTAFNISAYRSKPSITVTVTRGKVEVKRKQKVLGVLGKNEQIIYNAATENYSKKSVHADSYISWKNNELNFDDITFSEAAMIMSNKYNVQIVFKNENIRDCKFTAAFKNNETLEHVLSVICQLNKVSYRVEQNNIYIAGTGCE